MRKRTRRKVYALINPIQYAIQGACVSSQEDLNKLRLLELEALEAFRRGRATVHDWSDINAANNLAETMARNGIGIEVLAVAAEAQRHLLESADRYTKTHRMGATGPAMNVWRDMLEYHDLQRVSVSRSEYERMIQQTVNRMKSGAPEVKHL
jgi:hypothetical protein